MAAKRQRTHLERRPGQEDVQKRARLSQEEKRKRTYYRGIKLRDFFLVPNLLTLSRAAWAIPAVILILKGQEGQYDLLAAGLLLIAFLTDVVDGIWARTFHRISDLGKILDPLVDKFVVIIAALALGMPGRDPHLPHWLIIAILLRDVLIILLTSRVLREDHYLFTSSWTGKVATFSIAVTLLAFLLHAYVNERVMFSLPMISLGLLVLSGVDYLERYWGVRHKRRQKKISDQGDP